MKNFYHEKLHDKQNLKDLEKNASNFQEPRFLNTDNHYQKVSIPYFLSETENDQTPAFHNICCIHNETKISIGFICNDNTINTK